LRKPLIKHSWPWMLLLQPGRKQVYQTKMRNR